jgi:hypothetical protein
VGQEEEEQIDVKRKGKKVRRSGKRGEGKLRTHIYI